MLLSPQKFDGMAIGEIDWRAIDITADCDGVAVSSVSWACSFIGPSGADGSPGSRIVNQALVPSVAFLVGPLNSVRTVTGEIVLAFISGTPTSAAGGYYLLTASVTMPDGRILTKSARLLCCAS